MHDQTRGPSLGSPVNQQRVVRQEGLRHNANGATSHERGRLNENRKFCTPAELNNSFITERAVYLSIHSFGPDKTGGPDGLIPKFLQYFVENRIALKRLTKLFQCMLEIGYTPKKWSEAKVIFLQKPGKKDYSEPKSFRPISLITFLFKALEKVVLWQIQNTALKRYPFSKNQHAFRKGYSCQTAISDLVDSLEANVLRNKISLAVFIDISGAFNNAKYSSIKSAMIKRGISPKIIAWYQQFLKQRTAFTEIKGITSSVKVQRGCPQGGILSPIIWNCIFESFIELFNGSAASAHCYADDAALVVHGICVSTIVDIMQRELKKAFNWGKKESLIFVASITNAVFFHRKKKAITPKKLTMDDKTIEYQNEVKYLGVYLDSRLTWKFHIEQKITKAKKSIMLLRNSIGS